MPLILPIIRPPAEANSFLLQVTLGCSSNSCYFCAAYKFKPFRVKPNAEIFADIDSEGKKVKPNRRIFLIDGDAMCIKHIKLVKILSKIKHTLPNVTRISSYLNPSNLAKRTDTELKELYALGLKVFYVGLESGSQLVLNNVNKHENVEETISILTRLSRIGFKISLILLIGLGGKKHAAIHVKESIRAINIIQPHFLSFLSLMLVPGTKLMKMKYNNSFDELNKLELLKESRDIIEGLQLKKTVFHSNHPSNFIHLAGRLAADKKRFLSTLEKAISGKINCYPDYMRGL